MTKIEVAGLFVLAKIDVLDMFEIKNKYWGDINPVISAKEPWWLVKTNYGLVEIGWRKRVISIDWSDTKVRKVITSDDTTKDEYSVHAWLMPKALEYLTELSNQFKLLP